MGTSGWFSSSFFVVDATERWRWEEDCQDSRERERLLPESGVGVRHSGRRKVVSCDMLGVEYSSLLSEHSVDVCVPCAWLVVERRGVLPRSFTD